MGLRKVFQKKDPSEAQIVGDMEKDGMMTKNRFGGGRDEKFGAFKAYAEDRATRKPGLAPVNPYANQGANNGNPYAPGNEAPTNPANGGSTNPYGARSGGGSSQANNPYGGSLRGNSLAGVDGGKNNPYGGSRQSQLAAPRDERARAATRPASQRSAAATDRDPGSQQDSGYGGRTNPYGGPLGRSQAKSSRTGASLMKSSATLVTGDDESTLDLNSMAPNSIFEGKTTSRPKYEGSVLDLNEEEEEDLNCDIPDEEYDEDAELNLEDEEIEQIKQDIRFTKQESLASTRNTLRMAQEADAAATNTMGMLGSQSERLYNAEQNILLAGTQTKIAEDKVSELKRLNRLIFIPAYGNPFNKKLRLRRQEEDIKLRKAQEKYMRETNRQEMYQLEQRIKMGITTNATNGEVHQRYQLEKALAEAKRYQFENDLEDDEIEKELSQNLDQIGLYAKKLKQLAQTMGTEVDAQNARLAKIEEDADRLDINVHMNTTRLANIR